MSDQIIVLSDRVKELSYSVGTGNIELNGAANGFSSFSSRYSHNDELFYAITDGTRYEIGSGILLREDYDPGDGITTDQLVRFPLKSSNADSIVSFPAGTKEVYVTYPATHAVMMGSGMADFNTPQNQGIAFWSSSNVLNYDPNIIWDSDDARLGLLNPVPEYAIDIGGSPAESIVRSSGVILGPSGLVFEALNGYPGGMQLHHFEMNRLDQYAVDNVLLGELTGSSAVLELSGVVNQYILFKKQDAGHVFAGPPSGCTPPCSPGYPSFRPLVIEDLPFITEISGTLNSSIDSVSGNLTNSIFDVSNVFTVTENNFTYLFQGRFSNSLTVNPNLYLHRGLRYRFNIETDPTSGHIFFIKTAPTTGSGQVYNYGLSDNGILSGVIIFDVPHDAPDLLYYTCANHAGMSGIIYTQDIPTQELTDIINYVDETSGNLNNQIIDVSE